ncbi:hypothetical protein BBJ28_00013950 [Nothophytophthora sp. Chile5]|nr:hypothetical protein BBJ28_00013950 [Nothophytophthora sp. Chile5]
MSATHEIFTNALAIGESVPTCEAVSVEEVTFDAVIGKTAEKGLGIYFTKVAAPGGEGDLLAVDGFVGLSSPRVDTETDEPSNDGLSKLQLGDILISVNGANCRKIPVAETLDLLRSACIGPNTLSFMRCVAESTAVAEPDEGATKDALGSVSGGFMGALLKVKSKIRAEIDGDGEELLREQQENERFEKQWLEEFNVLKAQYETKWETCTYTADEFCGLLYRSSDAQQREYLLREYPTLMETWKDVNAASSSSRVIPDWPAAKLAYTACVELHPTSPDLPSYASGPAPRTIHCSHSLQQVLHCLREEFSWRSGDLLAISRKLESCGISSCFGLLAALDARSGHFERNFQSTEYPRLSKTIIRTLRKRTEQAVSEHENTSHLCMDQLRINSAA